MWLSSDWKTLHTHPAPNTSLGRQEKNTGGYPDLRVIAAISAFPVNNQWLCNSCECALK